MAKNSDNILGAKEINDRLIALAREWQAMDDKEIAESQSFLNSFFYCFGVERRRIATYERNVAKLNGATGRIDLFWPKMLLVEMKGPKVDLDKDQTLTQALDYCHSLSAKESPRFIMACNFNNFILLDLEATDAAKKEQRFSLQELPAHQSSFWFISGHQESRSYAQMDEASIKAAQKMAALYEALEKINNPDDELDLFMVRLLFCFFADSTQIFDDHIFKTYFHNYMNEDGTNIGDLLVKIFQMLNRNTDQRRNISDTELLAFPYVNGALYQGLTPTPLFNSKAKAVFDECLNTNWAEISPAIFGSLFQDINKPSARRTLGEHYTSEQNILKTLHPLFLDSLEAKLAKAGHNKDRLEALLAELSGLRLLDPSCGCGNFLVVAYRELRRLELKLLQRLHPVDNYQKYASVEGFSQLGVEQFYGIEINPFAAKIAQVALWMTDHQMNMELSTTYGRYYSRIPLVQAPHITCGNALRLEWPKLVEPSTLNYIVGNPPFVGSSLKNDEQQEESAALFADVASGKKLDYVANWYKKAVAYMKLNKAIVSAFVSTNSITQGEQVAPLWLPLLRDDGVVIHFAHRTFSWYNEGGNVAKVHCVIIGFALYNIDDKQLWDYQNPQDEQGVLSHCPNINPYLLAAPNVVVKARNKPLDESMPQMVYGSSPRENGNLFFTQQEKEAFVKAEPAAASFMRPCLGADEFINNIPRYCLWLRDALPSQLQAMPLVMERINKVKAFRQVSPRSGTRKASLTPYLLAEIRQSDSDYLLFPVVSSEKRDYVPIGYVDKDTIATNANFMLPNATPYLFGLLTSAMHMAWLAYTCGRLKSDYRYSNTIVYNNFPFPPKPKAELYAKIEALATTILTVRATYLEQGESYANLYNSTTMPNPLRAAHAALDKAVDSLYTPEKLHSQKQRIELLFKAYDAVINQLGL